MQSIYNQAVKELKEQELIAGDELTLTRAGAIEAYKQTLLTVLWARQRHLW